MSVVLISYIFFFQAEDGIRDLVRSRGLGDVYKRQTQAYPTGFLIHGDAGMVTEVDRIAADIQ